MKHGIPWGEDLGQLAEFYSSKRAVGESLSLKEAPLRFVLCSDGPLQGSIGGRGRFFFGCFFVFFWGGVGLMNE